MPSRPPTAPAAGAARQRSRPRPTEPEEPAADAAAVAAGAVLPVRFRIELPPGLELLNANVGKHFRAKAPVVRALREAARAAALAAGAPALQRAHVFYVVHPESTRRRRDPGNWAPAAKAAVDGLIDAHVLPDDNSTRLLGPDPRLGDPVPGTQLVLVVTDLTRVPDPYLRAFDPTRQLT